MDTNKTANSTTSKDEGTEKMARAAIEEARMVTPGIQALFGFQLVAAFNERFRQLGPIEQALHFMALVLVALSVDLPHVRRPCVVLGDLHPSSPTGATRSLPSAG